MKALTKLTFGAVFATVAFLSTPAEAANTARFDRLFDRADLDRDNFLSFAEYFSSQPRSARWIDATWRFEYNDVNSDNYIDRLEYRASRGGKTGRRPSKLDGFYLADQDEDGYLDVSEYGLTLPRNTLERRIRIRFSRRDRDSDDLISPREYGIRVIR